MYVIFLDYESAQELGTEEMDSVPRKGEYIDLGEGPGQVGTVQYGRTKDGTLAVVVAIRKLSPP